MKDFQSFHEELTSIFDRHREPKRTVVSAEVHKAIEEALKPEPATVLYDIHKRSLPVGTDQVIAIGFTKAEAQWFIKGRLKTKTFQDQMGRTYVIYYDAVRQDGGKAGVFDNDCQTTKENNDV